MSPEPPGPCWLLLSLSTTLLALLQSMSSDDMSQGVTGRGGSTGSSGCCPRPCWKLPWRVGGPVLLHERAPHGCIHGNLLLLVLSGPTPSCCCCCRGAAGAVSCCCSGVQLGGGVSANPCCAIRLGCWAADCGPTPCCCGCCPLAPCCCWNCCSARARSDRSSATLRRLAAGRSEGDAGCFSAARMTLAVCSGGRPGLLLLPPSSPATPPCPATLPAPDPSPAAAADPLPGRDASAAGAVCPRGLLASVGQLQGSGLGVLCPAHTAAAGRGPVLCCCCCWPKAPSPCGPQAPRRPPVPEALPGEGARKGGLCSGSDCGGHVGGDKDSCMSIGQSPSGSCKC